MTVDVLPRRARETTNLFLRRMGFWLSFSFQRGARAKQDGKQGVHTVAITKDTAKARAEVERVAGCGYDRTYGEKGGRKPSIQDSW